MTTAAGAGLWRLLPAVRRDERRRFAFFAALFALIGLAQTVGLVGAEALLLARLGVEALPVSFLVAAAGTVLATLAYGIAVGRFRNDTVFTGLFALGAVAVLGAALGARSGLAWPYFALFSLWYATQTVYLSHFWTFCGDFFDTLSSKRLFPLFTVGSSVGGLVGGVLATGMARVAPPEALVGVWALLLFGGAALVRAARRPLRRWGPLELEEADETSVEGLRAAVRHLGSSALGRWLVASALGMVLALFLMQYVYSEIFVRAFPSAEALAAFIALYLAVTNGVEILLEVLVTPALIHRLGVGSANLVHPILTLLCFAGLAFQPALPAAVAARMNRELFENAVSSSLRNLVHNALPARFRGRLRAFLEGIVVYGGMFAAGAALLLVGAVPLAWLCGAGAALGALYLVANLRVRREYMRSLVQGLRAGRLELVEVGDEIGRWEAGRLAALWEALLPESGTGRPEAASRLAPLLAARGVLAPLLAGIAHPDPRVRRACAQALGASRAPEAAGALARALTDADAEVRLAAVSGLARGEPGGAAAQALAARLGDPDPRVRAEAAAHAPQRGAAVLDEMLRSGDCEARIAALACAPAALLGSALGFARDADPRVRAAVLECAARLAPPLALSLSGLRAHLGDTDPRVRRAAVAVLAVCEERGTAEALAECLSDPDRGVRRQAASALGRLGEEGAAAAAARLASEQERGVGEVLLALAAAGGRVARQALDAELERCVEAAWRQLVLLCRFPEEGSAALVFLRAALEDAAAREQRLALRILSLREGTRTLRSVERALRFARARSRADALEVLSNLGDREMAWRLVLMLEDGPLAERLELAGADLRGAASAADVLQQSDGARDRWVRRAAMALARAEGGAPAPLEEEMERILMLRQVPLFSRLTLDQLEAIARLVGEAEYAAGEVILREGESGGDLYVLAQGEAEVVKAREGARPITLRTLQAPDYFGEMAVLDDAPRSASIVVRKDARLLVLRGDRLKELMLDVPEIAFEICRVLTVRLRAAEERLRAPATAGALPGGPSPGAPEIPRR